MHQLDLRRVKGDRSIREQGTVIFQADRHAEQADL